MKAAQRRLRDQRVVRLVKSGKSYRQVGRLVGLKSPSSVAAIVRQARERELPSALEAWRATN